MTGWRLKDKDVDVLLCSFESALRVRIEQNTD